MSTSAEFQDQAAFDEAMQKARDDSSKSAYIIVGHVEGKPNLVDVVATDVLESDTVDSMVSQLRDDEVMYALLKLPGSVDWSTTVKFVYVHWCGHDVPFVKKGRFGVVHGSVQEHFNPYHVAIETGDKDDLTQEKIEDKLKEAEGRKDKIVKPEDVDSRQKRGFTATQLPSHKRAQMTKVEIPKEGAAVNINADVPEGINDVRDDGTGTDWFVAGYEENDVKKPLTCIGSGAGGLSELTSFFEEDKVLYALYRVTDMIDDNISTVKFVYIVWVGEKLKPMAKAKVSTHKSRIEDFFKPAHVTIFATDKSEVSERVIMDKVTSSSGSKSHVKS